MSISGAHIDATGPGKNIISTWILPMSPSLRQTKPAPIAASEKAEGWYQSGAWRHNILELPAQFDYLLNQMC
jgi:hypothetical protein